jgi:hypothetical protein
MSKRSDEEEVGQHSPSAPRWKGSDSLDLVYRLNERSLQALKELAASLTQCDFLAVSRHRALWSSLTPEALSRAAQLPFVLLDVHFGDEAWWQRALAPVDRAPGDLVPANGSLPAEIADALMQETLIFAWHTVKWDQRVARLSLGMSPGVAKAMVAMTPQQLSVISSRHSRELRLRWQSQPDLWREVLRTAASTDDDALEEIYLHAKLLLCGELL